MVVNRQPLSPGPQGPAGEPGDFVDLRESDRAEMFAAVESGPVLCSDSNILCLSWKGRVPRSEKEKPVCRRRYYEEGWLATGNGRGVVGVTFTSSHCRRDRTTPQRINFNLRGHNSEVGRQTHITSLRLCDAEAISCKTPPDLGKMH